MATRTTLYLDEAVLARVRRFVPPRGLSALVNTLLEEKAQEWERAEIEAAMREGYLATRCERQALNVDWQAVDGEGWPG
ncbi:MAG: hypothetical protein NZ528_01275 [Caldilineales bacterium]|nr:hypothetical protein [Caldilineales bacterium]MDW8317116.1 hypothetical protein [Anaerolineae bacterium]